MASFRDDAQGVETIGVIQPQAPVQQPVSLNRDTVEHCCDRWNVFRWCCLNFLAGTKRRHGRREESHRLWPDEHDAVTDRKRYFLSLDQRMDLVRRQIRQDGFVGDLGYGRSLDYLSTSATEGFVEARVGLPLAHGALRAPQFDLQSHGGIGAVSEVVVEVGDGVLWNSI